MYRLGAITLLAACISLAAAKPMPSQAEVYATATTTSSGAEPTFTVTKRRRTYNCNQDDRLKNIEAKGWADAGAMAALAVQYDSGNKWQPAMNYWMGYDSKKSENFWKIQAALENENKIHNSNWLFPEAAVDIYCGDTKPNKKVCKYQKNPLDPNGPLVTAYASSWVERGWFWNSYNIVLCPRFFEEKTSLDSILYDMKFGNKNPSNASEYKLSWGHTIYHELMHLDPVIANEEVWDVAYGACLAAKLANQNGCSGNYLWTPPNWNSQRGDPHTMINADSWAFFASGVYFQEANSLSSPGRAPDTCGIYSGANLANFSLAAAEFAPEGILLPSVDRTDGTYNDTIPADPAPENTPPDDPPTPSLPYNATALPSGLATPFNASAYFATYTPTSAASPSSAPTTTTTTTTTTPPAPTCTGNQIEGSCVMGSLPSATPDSGPEPPACNKVDSSQDDLLMFNETQAANGAADYCAELISAGVVLSAAGSDPASGDVQNAAEKGGYVAFTVLFDVNSCDPNTASADQKLDFKAFGQDQCYQYLYTALAESCAKDSTWGDYNPAYSLEGGVYGASCALWSMEGLPSSL